MFLYNKQFLKSSRGFTLIELLVVVAIISLLSSVVMASLSTSRAKSRDAYRKEQLRQIQTGLELYYSTNGSYPNTSNQWYSSETGDGGIVNGGDWIPGLAPTYMSTLPKDPRGGQGIFAACSSWKSAFLYKSDGGNYKVLAHCSPESNFPVSGQTFYDPARPTWAWMLCSGEPACSSW